MVSNLSRSFYCSNGTLATIDTNCVLFLYNKGDFKGALSWSFFIQFSSFFVAAGASLQEYWKSLFTYTCLQSCSKHIFLILWEPIFNNKRYWKILKIILFFEFFCKNVISDIYTPWFFLRSLMLFLWVLVNILRSKFANL